MRINFLNLIFWDNNFSKIHTQSGLHAASERSSTSKTKEDEEEATTTGMIEIGIEITDIRGRLTTGTDPNALLKIIEAPSLHKTMTQDTSTAYPHQLKNSILQ